MPRPRLARVEFAGSDAVQRAERTTCPADARVQLTLAGQVAQA